MAQTAYLVLENGRRFAGETFGAVGEAVGQTVFATGMTSYLETLTDKSYYGQIVIQTFPLIGNYGVISPDLESSQPLLSAYVVKYWCREPSNFRSEGDLDTFLKDRGVIGLCGVDTRTLTKLLREAGALNGMVTTDPNDVDLDALKSYRSSGNLRRVGTEKPYHVGSGGRFKVCLYDFGLRESLLTELTNRDCDVTVLPPDSAPDMLAAYAPNGLVLSGGPGDPADNPDLIKNLQVVLDMGIPTMGVCLGGLMLAMARGCGRTALKHGRRGANLPIRDISDGRIYITFQNNGYALDIAAATAANRVKPLFVNVADGTCEGVEFPDRPAFTTRFQPGGDAAFLWDRFIRMMEDYTHALK